jgi:hypothetical protein
MSDAPASASRPHRPTSANARTPGTARTGRNGRPAGHATPTARPTQGSPGRRSSPPPVKQERTPRCREQTRPHDGEHGTLRCPAAGHQSTSANTSQINTSSRIAPTNSSTSA